MNGQYTGGSSATIWLCVLRDNLSSSLGSCFLVIYSYLKDGSEGQLPCSSNWLGVAVWETCLENYSLILFFFHSWLHHEAYGMLVPRWGIKPGPSAERAWNPNLRTTGDFPGGLF